MNDKSYTLRYEQPPLDEEKTDVHKEVTFQTNSLPSFMFYRFLSRNIKPIIIIASLAFYSGVLILVALKVNL